MIRRAALGLGTQIDKAFVRVAFKTERAGRRATRESVMARLDEAARLYPEADARGQLFPDPGPATLSERWLRGLASGELVDLRWSSGYEALHAAHARTLHRVPRNDTAHARWYRHSEPRPVLICLHGWGGGPYALEAPVFSARRFYAAGLDVVLMQLPFHGHRAPPRRRTPMFPSTDPVRSNEGFAQAIRDLRALSQALRLRGAPAIAVFGMSLGGATTALLATVDETLDAAVPLIPFSSLGRLLWEHGDGTAARRAAVDNGITQARFSRAFDAVTPLARSLRISGDRVLVIAGTRDRVVPASHGEELHAHFRGSLYDTWDGSHLLQLGRGRAFRSVRDFVLARAGQSASQNP